MFIQALGFALITYFLYGLDTAVDIFVVHVFILMLIALAIANFFRLVKRRKGERERERERERREGDFLYGIGLIGQQMNLWFTLLF